MGRSAKKLWERENVWNQSTPGRARTYANVSPTARVGVLRYLTGAFISHTAITAERFLIFTTPTRKTKQNKKKKAKNKFNTPSLLLRPDQRYT